jgi:hypothetical protein
VRVTQLSDGGISNVCNGAVGVQGPVGGLALGDAIGMVRASASERTSMRPSGNDANAPRAFRSLKL